VLVACGGDGGDGALSDDEDRGAATAHDRAGKGSRETSSDMPEVDSGPRQDGGGSSVGPDAGTAMIRESPDGGTETRDGSTGSLDGGTDATTAPDTSAPRDTGMPDADADAGEIAPNPQPDSGPAPAASLAGFWAGTLRSDDGTSTPYRLQFSASDNFVFGYVNNSGQARQVELTMLNQGFQFVPRGGGVATVTVHVLMKSAGKLRVGWKYRYEVSDSTTGNSESYYDEVVYSFVLIGAGLETTLIDDGSYAVNNLLFSSSREVSTGTLQREPAAGPPNGG
jgi:hypothetical protein